MERFPLLVSIDFSAIEITKVTAINVLKDIKQKKSRKFVPRKLYGFVYRKYQVKPHSSPWFSAACATATFHRNEFFRFN